MDEFVLREVLRRPAWIYSKAGRIILVLFVILGLTRAAAALFPEGHAWKLPATVVICAIGVGATLTATKVPRTSRHRIGVLLAITTAQDKNAPVLRRTLIPEIRRRLEDHQASTRFQVIEAPPALAEITQTANEAA